MFYLKIIRVLTIGYNRYDLDSASDVEAFYYKNITIHYNGVKRDILSSEIIVEREGLHRFSWKKKHDACAFFVIHYKIATFYYKWRDYVFF